MRLATGAVYGTVAVVVGLTLVSGPLVGAVDFTRDRSDLAGLGTGNISVDRVSAPAKAELDGTSRSDSFRLEVRDATLNVTSISGRPVVVYRLDVSALEYARTTSHFLDESAVGTVRLSLRPATLSAGRVDARQYEGTLSVIARYNGTERVLYEDSVAIDVTT